MPWLMFGFLLCHACWAGPKAAGIVMASRSITFNGRTYVATLIENGTHVTGRTSGDEDRFMKRLEGWITEQFQAGVITAEEKREIAQAVAAESPALGANSVLILSEITRDFNVPDWLTDPRARELARKQGIASSRVIGMIRASKRGSGSDENLAVEKRLAKLGVKIDTPVPVAVEGARPPGLVPYWLPEEAQPEGWNRLFLGDVIEVKNFIVPVNPEIHVPLIYYLAESHGLFDTGMYVARGETGPGALKGPVRLIPSEYILEAITPAHIRYYSHMGIRQWTHEVEDPQRPGKKVRILRWDRATLRSKVAAWMDTREGRKFLGEAQVGMMMVTIGDGPDRGTAHVVEVFRPLLTSSEECRKALLPARAAPAEPRK